MSHTQFSGGLDVYGLFGDSSSAPVNLTTEGNLDWIHWGDSRRLNRKAGVSPQLSNYTIVGAGTGHACHRRSPVLELDRWRSDGD